MYIYIFIYKNYIIIIVINDTFLGIDISWLYIKIIL